MGPGNGHGNEIIPHYQRLAWEELQGSGGEVPDAASCFRVFSCTVNIRSVSVRSGAGRSESSREHVEARLCCPPRAVSHANIGTHIQELGWDIREHWVARCKTQYCAIFGCNYLEMPSWLCFCSVKNPDKCVVNIWDMRNCEPEF